MAVKGPARDAVPGGIRPEDETQHHRHVACCRAEPLCVLCPLRPENEGRSLRDLWRAGLYANLPRLGFR